LGADQKKVEVKMEAYQEKTEANKEKMKADREELEASQEKIGAGAKHYNRTTCVKPHRTGLSMLQIETLMGRRARRVSRYLRTDLGRSIWLQGTAINGKHGTKASLSSYRSFATAIELVDPPCLSCTSGEPVQKGPGKAFGNGMRNRGVKQQPLPEFKRTFNEALKHTLELEVMKLLGVFHQAAENE
jgi:hypothetical protein